MPHRDGRQTVLVLDSEFLSMENTPRTASLRERKNEKREMKNEKQRKK